MDDLKIVELFWQRDENALKLTEEKYKHYCHYIAYNILQSDSDSEECVNDTLLRAWSSIPPAKPKSLKAYLGKITRNLAIDLYNRGKAKKRDGGIPLIYDELAECIPDTVGKSDLTEEVALKGAINGFLASLNKRSRIVFMQRYWYLLSVKDIAKANLMSESNVKITLLRLRAKLKKYLEKEGIVI
ncbi:MAG: sigma-70 family RNA polymerase sigma factor [Clostridia bacterium]|nr:sigma-70 family RNA polymerase sigma factor [Clostridia bacterium]